MQTEDALPAERARREISHLERLAVALATAENAAEILEAAGRECRGALAADAVCTYSLKGDRFELISENGCSPEFKSVCRRIRKNLIPAESLADNEDGIFFGSCTEFIAKIPVLAKIARQTDRRTIGYAPIVVRGKIMGFIGFSFNNTPDIPTDKLFVLSLVKICAQGLERILANENEKAARREAETANRAKSEFLINVNHEIRTPLGIIQGFADLLASSPALRPAERKWTEIIQRNCRQLNRLFGQVLDISKIEGEKLEIETHSFSLQEQLPEIRILVIDDSADIRELIEFYLAQAGAKAQFAESARSGIERALKEDFDIVLMDIQMPLMNGHEAVATLRTRGYNKPIIALTANALTSERRKCLLEGFDDYLTKPIEWPALVRSAQALLRIH